MQTRVNAALRNGVDGNRIRHTWTVPNKSRNSSRRADLCLNKKKENKNGKLSGLLLPDLSLSALRLRPLDERTGGGRWQKVGRNLFCAFTASRAEEMSEACHRVEAGPEGTRKVLALLRNQAIQTYNLEINQAEPPPPLPPKRVHQTILCRASRRSTPQKIGTKKRKKKKEKRELCNTKGSKDWFIAIISLLVLFYFGSR